MRKILFRGKRTDNGEWVEGNLFVPDKEDTPTQICIGTNVIRITYDVIPETVGQYTGLTDKNGKKIFEGDIVKHDFGADQIGVQYAVIKYNSYYASFLVEPLYDWMFCEKNDCEVIGNIHDNPELLKGAEQ